ncbi:MAG: thioredoxin [Bacteroidetes bacterium]|nr:MAG: thioredoxin [Bacteroidota bacterium]
MAVTEVTDATFEEIVLKSEIPVMVDLWAVWCGPCRMIHPIIEELSEDYAGKALMTKLDVDNNRKTAMKYGIRNIPTVLFIKNGEVVDKQVGAVPKKKFQDKLEAIL